jgi:hypothetical protein
MVAESFFGELDEHYGRAMTGFEPAIPLYPLVIYMVYTAGSFLW